MTKSYYVTITFTSLIRASAEIIITDLQGKVSLKKSITANVGINNIGLDIRNIPKGIHAITVQNNNATKIVKSKTLIKEE